MRVARQPQDVVENRSPGKILLSRLAITGHVHEHTPMCVLMEIADAHGIMYEQKDLEKPTFSHHLLASIHQTLIPSIGEVKEISEWQYVARFVNKRLSWPQPKLIQAYNFLLGFMNNENPLSKIPQPFTTGLQTPETPFSINACILYKICVHHRLNVTARTTLSQMAYAVRMLRENTESVSRRVDVFLRGDANRIDLINILMLSRHEIQDPEQPLSHEPIKYEIVPKVEMNYELLMSLYDHLSDVANLRQRIDPTTQSGAVALAALNYGIDISKSANPMREYKILKANGRIEYKPVDSWMQYWYERNQALFDLSVTFNPLFSIGFYDPQRLTAMIHNEGYTAIEINEADPYELLQIAYLSETFYQGEMPNMTSRETPINLDDVEDVPYGQLICFGQLDVSMRPISVVELTELFNRYRNFTNPFRDDTVFTKTAIMKLKLIAQSPSGSDPSIRLSPWTIQRRADLLNAINGVELLQQSNDAASRELALTYRNASPETKQVIRSALVNILHLGMYMRGWIGEGEYPILEAPVPPEHVGNVMIKVTEAIASFESSCRSLGKIGTQIRNLPLILHKDGEYQPAVDEREGITIGERLDIVKRGDDTTNVNSCIRLSSNWYCSSAHKYLMCLGFDAPFDIYNLRHIS